MLWESKLLKNSISGVSVGNSNKKMKVLLLIKIKQFNVNKC
jgi:hypothetical protein